MANEHLQRTPTSSGNRSTYTWSGWIKRNILGDWARLFSTAGQTMIQFTGSSPQDQIRYFHQVSGNFDLRSSALLRDVGSWMHLVVSVDHTNQHSKNRVRMFLNGAEIDNYGTDSSSNGAQNLFTYFNSITEHALLGRESTNAGENFRGEAFDIFWVDGQALTPDVFGFYKDGDGYQSSGTDRATDFRSGQWSPRLPKSIKHTINRGGGFGVNGFYLPMNDSSNFGADFHCTPNSIIKLKGEDLPQPRNGAPTTSDSYASQLREEKGSEDLPFEGVVRFGGFDTNSSLKFPDNNDLDLGASPFTAECWIYPQDTSQSNFGALFNKGFGFQVYWKSDIEALQLFGSSDGSNYDMINGVTTRNGSVPKGKWTHIAVVRESGNNTWKIYTNGQLTYGPLVVSGTLHNNGNPWGIGDYVPSPGVYEYKGFVSDFRLVVGSAVYTAPFTPPTTRLTNITNTKLLCCQSATNVTEAAVAPTTGGTAGGAETFATKNEMTGSIELAIPGVVDGLGSGFGDYSHLIRGSGSAKTVTTSGGTNHRTGNSYYGSAMNFDGTDDKLSFDNAVTNPRTQDFTYEFWIAPDDWSGSYTGLLTLTAATGAKRFETVIHNNNIQVYTDSATWRDTGFQLPKDQWTHIAFERYYGYLTMYVNGVPKWSVTNTRNYDEAFSTKQQFGLHASSYGKFDGLLQDVRFYTGVAKYKGGFDVPNHYSPQDIATHRVRVDNSKNNFVTMNPLSKSGCTLSSGNLTVSDSSSSGGQVYSTMGSDTGKWYYEAHITDVGGPGGIILGINPLRRPAGNVQNRTGYRSSGDVYNDSGSVQQTGTSYTTGDIIGVAWDADNKKLWFAKNGSWVYSGDPVNGGNQATVYSNSETQGPSVQYDNGGITQIVNFNFGQNPSFSGQVTAGTNTDGNGKGLFKYAPPTGFLALCDDNLPTPVADPGKHFKTVLWSGDGLNGHAITKVGFKPDLVWIFNRDRATYKPVFDIVRGAKNMLRSNQDVAQGTFDTVLQSFDSDGFTVGNDGAHNFSGERISAWCWKAGGLPVPNNEGSLSSQVSANQEAGFSIVKFTAQTSSTGTVGHGLGKKPAFWIWKDINGATGWYVYHQRMGSSAWLKFDAQLATTGNAAAWGGVDPTTTVFTHGSGLANQNDIIMYIWAEIQGYSKFGNYIGNGANEGPHVYCGFKPAWVLIKKRDGSGDENWRLFDSSRCPINQNDKHAVISSSGDESTESGIDLLSNGFKVRHNDGHQNQDGSEYIFAAFAESPFQTANAK